MKLTTDYFKNIPKRFLLMLSMALLLLPFAIKSDVSGQRKRPIVAVSGDNSGLVFRLSEAQEETQGKTQTQLPRPVTEQLSDEATQNLLKRLPPIKVEG